jgi:uncharacterized peroxidase-related enzyme
MFGGLETFACGAKPQETTMSRIQPTTETNAPDATKPILAQLKQGLGMVPNLFATIGHSPGSLAGVMGWDAAVGKGTLSKREIELLNLHISELNGCGYCVRAHNALGKMSGLNDNDIQSARDGVGANEREHALLAFARRVVRTGGARAGTEVARLREAGVKDAAIIDVLAIVALKTFTNAVAVVAQTDIDFPKAARLASE